MRNDEAAEVKIFTGSEVLCAEDSGDSGHGEAEEDAEARGDGADDAVWWKKQRHN